MLLMLLAFLLGMFVAWFFVAPPRLARDLLVKLLDICPGLARYKRDDA